MVKNPHINDTKTDRSDVLSMLETIKEMFRVSQNTLNEYSRRSLLLSISIEGEMLCVKLKAMHKRWRIHLPFKEACSVDFYDWARTIDEMSRNLSGRYANTSEADSYCPSKHFLLDLYDILPEEAPDDKEIRPYYEETNIAEMIRRQERMRKEMTTKWPEYKRRLSEHTLQRVSFRLHTDLMPLLDSSAIQKVCQEVLADLANLLSQLSDLSLRVITGDAYMRLAERIVNEQEYEGRKAQRKALLYFSNWKNGTPEDQIVSERDYEIDVAVTAINEMKYGRFLGRYVRLKDDVERQMKGLGQFLNQYRYDIGIEELRNILELLYRIHFFLEEKRQAEAAEHKEEPVAKDESTAQPKEEPQQPSVELPKYFHHDLRVNAEATQLLIETVRRVGKYMCCNLTNKEKELPEARNYVKWKWNHLLQTFIDMELVDKGTTQTDFAKFIVDVLTDRKVNNILQSFYRNCDNKNTSILADVKDEFHPVKVMMRKGLS